jgi:hypothetical protein
MHVTSTSPRAGGEIAAVQRVTAAPPRYLRAVLALVATVAVAGLGLGLQTIVSGSDAHPVVVREAPADGAWARTAGFGPIAVERVARTVSTITGAHRGHPDSPHERFEVRVRLDNRRAQGVPFSPGQFRLEVVGPGTTLTALDPNAPPDAIGGERSLRTDISFLVHGADRRFALVFADVTTSRQIRIPLGVVPAVTAGTGGAGERK